MYINTTKYFNAFTAQKNFRMYNRIFLIILLASVCLAEDDSNEVARKRYKHKHHLLHHSGILYYLAFLAVKVKIAFLVGSMISFWLFAGKLFGILKYGFANFKSSEPEKIFVQSPHPTYYPPTSGYFDHDSGDRGDIKYGRNLEDGIYNTIEVFNNIIHKFDLNNYAFDSMDIKTEDCRKRFVCEAEYKASKNPLLKLGMRMINDNSLDRYKTSEEIAQFDDCLKLYPGCESEPTRGDT